MLESRKARGANKRYILKPSWMIVDMPSNEKPLEWVGCWHGPTIDPPIRVMPI